MEIKHLTLIEQLSSHHNIEVSFINALHDNGLIKLTVIENNAYLHNEQLKDLEKMIRLHYDLKINIEGIDVISNLSMTVG